MHHPKVRDHANPPSSWDNPFVRPRGDSRPIHNIPFELLARMFRFGAAYDDRPIHALSTAYKYQLLEDDAGEEPASEFTISTFQTRQSTSFHVSHVCRHWRDVAISTPSLWTDIRLSMDTARPPYMLVSLHLERSNPLPIDINVSEHPSIPNQETLYADAKSLYALLIPHIHRWRSVDLFCAKSQNMAAFLATISSRTAPPASRLESLRLHHHFNDVEFYLADPVLSGFRTLFNGSAPRLKHLSLAAVHIEWNQTLIAAAPNLTTLELFYHIDHVRPSWIQFATILRGAPALEKLTLHKSAPSEHPDDWVFESAETSATDEDLNVPIPLLHLKELVLGSLPEDVAVGLLQHLFMPALKTLILDLKDGDYSEFVNELTGPTAAAAASLSNSPPLTKDTPPRLLERLERLAIFNLACEDQSSMSTMFAQLENLTVLRLSPTPDLESDADVCPHLLRHLGADTTIQNTVTVTTTAGNTLHHLPHLESLIVSPSKAHIPLLRDLVQKRKDAAAPLRSLCVSFEEFRDWETMQWFRERVGMVSFVEELYCLNTDRAFEMNWCEVAGLAS